MHKSLERLYLRCRAAGDECMRLDRSNDGRSRRDIGTFADDHARNDGRTRSDKTILSAGNPSGEIAARCNLDIILDDVVVIDNGAGIDDGEVPDHRSRVDDGPCHDDGAMTDLHVWGDHGGRMNKRDELAAGRQDHFGKGPAGGGIANGDNKPMRRSELRDYILCRSFGFESCRSGIWIVVDEARDGFSSGPRNVRNHAAMGAASDDLYGSFRARHDQMPGLRTTPECWVCRHAEEMGLI